MTKQENPGSQSLEANSEMSDRYFRAVFDGALDAMLITDNQGIYVDANPAACALFNLSRNQLLGRQIADVLIPNFNLARINQTLAPNSRIEFRLLRPDGVMRFVEYATTVNVLPNRHLVILRDITESKQTKEALYQREQQYRALVENSPDIIARFDRQFRHVYVNPAVERATGLPPAAFIGSTHQELKMPEELVSYWQTSIQKVFDQAEEEVIEFDFPTPTGLRSYHSLLVPEPARDGSVEFVLGLTRDITQRKQAELAWRQNEQKYCFVVDNVQEVIFQTDARGLWTFLNPAWSVITGFSVEESLGTPFLNYIHPDDRQQNLELFQLLMERQKKHCRCEIRYLRKEGGVRWVEVNARLTLDATGLVCGISGTLNDITKRKQVEMALRQSEQRLQLVIDATNDAIWDWNLDSFTMFWSNKVYEFLGLEPGILKPSYKTVYRRVHPDDQKQFSQAVRNHLKFDHPYRVELRLRRADDSYGWFLLMGKAIRDNRGQLVRMAGSMSDISDRKRVEEQIKASLREKEVLLGEIHHRVKNNLSIISSLLYLQANRSKDKSVREILQDSRNRIDSMALVHESLYGAQNFAEINWVEYVQKLLANLLRTYSVQSDAIQCRISMKTDSFINLDQAIPCGLIVNELITNALKHGFSNHQKGEVFVTLEAAGDRQLLLRVGNSGDTLPRDFDIQMTQSMGLKLVLTLVNQLKGTITLDRGNTTVFNIKFSI